MTLPGWAAAMQPVDMKSDYIEALLMCELGQLDTYRSRGKDFQSCLRRVWVLMTAQSEYTPPPLPKPAAAPAARRGFVYFVQVGRYIKIGYTTTLAKRLKSIETLAPEAPVMLHHEPGTVADERAYHRRFKDSHVRREWFSREGALATFIAGLQR